jgi:hypothetical protein
MTIEEIKEFVMRKESLIFFSGLIFGISIGLAIK